MENIIKQLKKGAQHTRMSADEKANMRNVLVRHVQANPVQNFAGSNARSILSPLQINNLRNKKTMPILVILGLLMGGSASFAAENTVPGDVLYPVKVHVNESVRGAVAVSPAAKAEWEVKLVERRLEEVKKLATTPDVAPAVQQQAQENLATYTHHVEDRIAKFEEDEDGEDAIKTSSNLSNVLASYEQLLAALAAAQPASVATTTATSTATTTPATTSTSTASTTVASVASSTTPVSTLTPANIAALREILSKLNEVHNDAEEKHKELKKKYHHDEEGDEDNSNEDEDDHVRGNAAVTPVVAPASTATSTASTASSTTATTTTPAATTTPTAHVEDHEGEDHQEEIRSSENTETVKVESERREEKKRAESQREGTRN